MAAGDIGKLPKWAQQEIERLNGSVEHHKRRLRESIPNGEGASDTIVYMGYGEEHVGLPNGTPIRFQFEGGVIEVRVRDGVLGVLAVNGSIGVFPQVTNSVNIELIRR